MSSAPRIVPPDLQPDGPHLEAEEDPFRTLVRAHFALSAIRRRKTLTATIFVLGMLASLLALRLWPKVYHVETRLLAQRPEALPAAVRQGTEADEAPTKSAYDVVHRRDNLIELIKETGIYTAQAQQKKPSLRERLGLPPLGVLLFFSGDDDPLNRLVTRLDKVLTVTIGDPTVTIAIDWPDPEQAYRIVGAALQNFIESRQLQEITAVDEMISLLEGRTDSLRRALQLEEENVAHEREKVPVSAPKLASRPATAPKPFGREELAELKSMLEAKQRAIKDVEEFRRRRLADLQAQLDEKRGIYSDAYPSVVSLQQDIAALSKQSPQVEQLLDESKKLAAEIAVREREFVAQDPTAKVPADSARVDSRASAQAHMLAPETVEQNERVHDARFRYERMVERLNQAQLQLDAARAEFKYRYVVVWPAQLPKTPTSPKPAIVLGAGVVLSLLLAILCAVLAELRAGLLFEKWQVEEYVGLPVIAELAGRQGSGV